MINLHLLILILVCCFSAACVDNDTMLFGLMLSLMKFKLNAAPHSSLKLVEVGLHLVGLNQLPKD